MTTQEQELFKAWAHGLMIGCMVPIVAYNVMIRKWRNLFIYGLAVTAEIYFISEHLKELEGCECEPGKQHYEKVN